jgi:predicted nucleic acid-binding protein
MRRGARRGGESGRVGVLDAGIVLIRLDRRHAAHDDVCRLFAESADGRVALQISVVNVAEVLQHARRYSEATGLDAIALLHAFSIAVHRPDLEVVRRAAALATWPDLSMADRFAAATAATVRGRLYTADQTLAKTLRQSRLPVTSL